MPGTPEQDGWILRVLGVGLPGGTAGKTPVEPVLPIWRDAKEQVDSRIEALSRELRGFGDDDLERIADFGLFGITDRETVALSAALFEFDRAGSDKSAAAGKLRGAIKAYRAAVGGNELVDLLDSAPFQTKVGLRATMFGALAQIESSIGRAVR